MRALKPESILKNLRRDLDSHSEMKRCTPGKDLSEPATSIADPRTTSSDAPAGEGSIGYRVAALLAMLLLALAALVIWFYLRAS